MSVWARALILLVLAGPAWAQAPEKSPRPIARPTAQGGVPRIPRVPVYYNADHRPQARPTRAMASAQPARVPVQYTASYRPQARPAGLARTAPPSTAAAPQAQTRIKATSSKGKICGDRALRGETLSPIAGQLRGCGLDKPVKLFEVDGVRLNAPAVVDCTTAKAVKRWIKDGVRPAVGRLGGGVSELRVVASYSCRTRNHKPGAKISEHGKGRAIDISEVRLKNGATLNVLHDWRDPVKGKLLKKMHKSACKSFGTVLGPDADRYHQDHFHFDTARHRSGSYCR